MSTQGPLPPNRACGSPAHGSPVSGVTCKRTGRPPHGLPPARTADARQRRHSASFHSLFESRQHTRRPHRRCSPSPAGADLSSEFSRRGGRHWRWVIFRRWRQHVSTFLRPFAQRPLQARPRYYERSDCCPGLAAQAALPTSRMRVGRTIPSPTTQGSAIVPFARWYPGRWLTSHPRLDCSESTTSNGRSDFARG